MPTSGWIGVDLDGTLAIYGGWTGEIGPPVLPMVNRVKAWLAQGVEVRIVTARVACTYQDVAESGKCDDVAFATEQRALIEAWCERYIGQKLRVTAQKDFAMITLYDDRCVQVEANTGRLIGGGA